MLNIANARLSYNHLILVTFALLLLTGSGSTWARTVRMRPVWIVGEQELEFQFPTKEVVTFEFGEAEKEEPSQSQSQSLIQCIPPGGDCVKARNCCSGYYCNLNLPIPRCVVKKFAVAN